METKLEKFALIIVIAFATIGVLFSSIVVHEFSHYQDFRFLNSTGNLCLIDIPSNMDGSLAYYNVSLASQVLPDGLNVRKYTEPKAYLISGIFMFIGLGIIAIYLYERIVTNKRDEEDLKEEVFRLLFKDYQSPLNRKI